jgi:hypothetical protein
MTDLDDKLSKLIRDHAAYMKHLEIASDSKISHTAVKGAIHTASEVNKQVVAQIKQTFMLEGYHKLFEIDGRTILEYRGQPYMTGSMWYDRFEKELKSNTDRRFADKEMLLLSKVLKAAKRASGLE